MVLIVNGKGGVGKDYLVSALCREFILKTISSVDKVKEAASMLGCNIIKKDVQDRAFLSDLKALSAKYYDHPVKYMIREFEYFLQDHYDILVFMIREEDEIKRVKSILQNDKGFNNIFTILVTREDKKGAVYNNSSDDKVGEDLSIYDLKFENKINDRKNDLSFVNKIYEFYESIE